jgi:hypothetical protein
MSILEDAIIKVGQSYVHVDFVVVDTGGDEKSPIILGRPFLCATKAIIYAEQAKIVFTIKDKKEKFSSRSRMLHSPARPHAPYKRDEPVTIKEKKKCNISQFCVIEKSQLFLNLNFCLNVCCMQMLGQT